MATSASTIISAATGGAGNLGTLYIKLVADVSGVDKGIKDAERAVTSGARGIENAAMVATAAVVGLAVAAVSEFAKFESSFANVRKTVQATSEELKAFEKQFRFMATQLPTNVNEINNIAAAAGQLGIQKEAITSFTRTMIDLGNTTNLHGVHAAQNLARLANITGMAQKDFDRLGSTISELDRSTATTASEILTMSLRIAGAGKVIGMTEAQIVSLGAALSSIGIGAEAGGTAISQTMIEMAQSVEQGTKELQLFGRIAGMTGEQFQTLFRKNATEALLRFTEGLKAVEAAGGDAFTVLDQLGMDGARITRTLISAAEAGDFFRGIMEKGTQAWKDNTTTTEMAAERYKTLHSQLTITWNRMKDMLITIGEGLAPSLRDFNQILQDNTASTGALAERLGFLSSKILPGVLFAVNTVHMGILGWQLAVKTIQLKFMEMGDVVQGVLVKMTSGAQNQLNKFIDIFNSGIHPSMHLRRFSFADEVKTDAQAIKETIIELQGELATLGFEAIGAGFKMKENWKQTTSETQTLQPQLQKVGETFKMIGEHVHHDTFELEGFLHGLKLVNLEAQKTANDINVDNLLNKLGAPDPRDFSGAKRGMTKVEMLMGARGGIGGDQLGMMELQVNAEIELNQRKVDELEKLQGMEGMMHDEFLRRKLQALEMYNMRAKALHDAQTQMMMSSFNSIGENMLQIGAVFFGKQTAMYKAMFAASKAFAIAESIVKIQQGIASAAALPWPVNLAAIASVVAATANIVSTIAAVKLEFGGGKELGGDVRPGKVFAVGEGGPELFVPRSQGTIIPNDQLRGGGPIRVVINNYTDAHPTVNDRMEGDERVIEVIVRRTKDELASDVRDQKGNFPRQLENTYKLRRG